MVSKSKAPKVQASESEIALAEVAATKWQRFKDKAIPLENAYIEKIRRLGGAGETDALAGQGVATVQQSVAGPEGEITDNPGSGSFLKRLTRVGLSTAGARAGAETSARAGARGRRLAGLSSVIKLGKGIEDLALSGLSRRGQADTSRAIAKANAQFVEDEAKAELAGTLAGIGLDYGLRKPPPMRAGRTVSAAKVIPGTDPNFTLNLP